MFACSEGLVKISSSLYESILPLVKTQVESQIKVRDLSKSSVTIEPAEFGSWADARAALVTEAKRPLKAQLEQEIAALGGATDANKEAIAKVRASYRQLEVKKEQEVDHEPREMHLSLSASYNFLTQ